jgi:Zn-dependent metalloprotease
MNMRRPAFAALCAACALVVGIPALLTFAAAAEREAGQPVVRHLSDVALPVDAETLDRQYRALSSMPSVKVAYSALGPVRSVEGPTGIVLSNPTRHLQAGSAAPEILQKFKDVLLAAGSETLKVRGNQMSAAGRHRYIDTDQFINGIPVLYGSVSLRFEEGSGLVDLLGANFLPDRGLPRQPKISEADAAKRVVQHLVERGGAKPGSVETSPPTLAYHGTHPGSTRGRLVWAVPARYTAEGSEDGIFWIDAVDGEYVGGDALSKNLFSVYSANNIPFDPATFPNSLEWLFNHPGSSSDALAMNASNNMAASLQALAVDGSWSQPVGTLGLILHYGFARDDARQATYTRVNGVDYIRFGDGWPDWFIGPLGNPRDVVAHELGHGIARSYFAPAGGALFDSQSGAIDEGYGDVVAAFVDMFHRNGVPDDPATWTIAEIYTNPPITRGLRSMKDPKSMSASARDWFPARDLRRDKDTRHDNSTILSHAFKLLMTPPPTGATHVRAGQPILDFGVQGTIPNLFVPGLGPVKTRQIFFETFRNSTLDNFPDFLKVKAAAVSAANLLYGSFEADAVDRAFRAVGVGVNCSAPPQSPGLEAVHRCPRWVLRWPTVPGATTYYGEMNPVAWGWVNALTIVNGNVDSCTRTVSTQSHARVMACNGCGCSAWSNIVQMEYWPQCP